MTPDPRQYGPWEAKRSSFVSARPWGVWRSRLRPDGTPLAHSGEWACGKRRADTPARFYHRAPMRTFGSFESANYAALQLNGKVPS